MERNRIIKNIVRPAAAIGMLLTANACTSDHTSSAKEAPVAQTVTALHAPKDGPVIVPTFGGCDPNAIYRVDLDNKNDEVIVPLDKTLPGFEGSAFSFTGQDASMAYKEGVPQTLEWDTTTANQHPGVTAHSGNSSVSVYLNTLNDTHLEFSRECFPSS